MTYRELSLVLRIARAAVIGRAEARIAVLTHVQFSTMELICETLSGNRSDRNYRRQFFFRLTSKKKRYSRHKMDEFMLC